jgi:uncharacterized Tic20 family protein
MKKFQKYGIWWLILLLLTLIVSLITSHQPTFAGILSTMGGHLGFAIVVSLLPLGVYRIAGKPLNGEEYMATVTMGWLILAVANLAVM